MEEEAAGRSKLQPPWVGNKAHAEVTNVKSLKRPLEAKRALIKKAEINMFTAERNKFKAWFKTWVWSLQLISPFKISVFGEL